MRFAYRTNRRNVGQITKTPAEEAEYEIDWAGGILTGDSVSSVSSAARNSSNVDAAATVLDTTTNSGTITTVRLLTAGTGGTADATEDGRFKITTTCNLTNGGELQLQVYLMIRGGGTYGPTA